ncbi:hypothetical protein CSKR_203345 [Clonorchis sinensis]|uniref:Uncharacterized protein n=1 Tax=Clonorchis sinensis TaxID=79923 RepID=A0A8T1M9A9_CLOSI|nr:hypothetical protein CSKR_203345 [Clonorchis sinensis]
MISIERLSISQTVNAPERYTDLSGMNMCATSHEREVDPLSLSNTARVSNMSCLHAPRESKRKSVMVVPINGPKNLPTIPVDIVVCHLQVRIAASRNLWHPPAISLTASSSFITNG